jgi:uracil-DNA glycosylase
VSACADYLDAEWRLLKHKRVLFALGKIAWDACLALAARNNIVIPRPRPMFGHAAEVRLSESLALIGSYHVSQQNTFTGKLTNQMLDDVLNRAKEISERRRT